jgi:hypothetical protein
MHVQEVNPTIHFASSHLVMKEMCRRPLFLIEGSMSCMFLVTNGEMERCVLVLARYLVVELKFLFNTILI